MDSSAPRAATNASMASLPLMSSGAGPEKAINSPNPGVFGAGGGGGGVLISCNASRYWVNPTIDKGTCASLVSYSHVVVRSRKHVRYNDGIDSTDKENKKSERFIAIYEKA